MATTLPQLNLWSRFVVVAIKMTEPNLAFGDPCVGCQWFECWAFGLLRSLNIFRFTLATLCWLWQQWRCHCSSDSSREAMVPEKPGKHVFELIAELKSITNIIWLKQDMTYCGHRMGPTVARSGTYCGPCIFLLQA